MEIEIGNVVKIVRLSQIFYGGKYGMLAEVVEKRKVEVPKEVTAIVACFNPNCITNKEEVTTKFRTINKKPLQLQCYFCERVMTRKEIRVN